MLSGYFQNLVAISLLIHIVASVYILKSTPVEEVLYR